jgi:hypothetical protein
MTRIARIMTTDRVNPLPNLFSIELRMDMKPMVARSNRKARAINMIVTIRTSKTVPTPNSKQQNRNRNVRSQIIIVTGPHKYI